jgi:hypothetical protein
MKGPLSESASPLRAGDVVITLVLLVTFVSAYVVAQPWPFEAKLFPQLLCAAGVVLAVLKLVECLMQVRHRRQQLRRVGPGGVASVEVEADDEDDEDGEQDGREHSPEYIFGTAGRRAWAAALGWVATFFVALYLFGVFVTVPLFALAYLLICGRHGWLGATVYAGVAGSVVWFVFSHLLAVPMPAGIF